MRALSLLGLVAAADSSAQPREISPPYLWEVGIPQSRIGLVKPVRSGLAAQLRSVENCIFPLDVVILQDATESFQDNIDSMRNTQLDLIFKGITSRHPDSRFAVVSFKDKPVTPFGNRDDYCTRFDAPLSADINEVKKAYANILAYGGADAPENQFGTLYNVLSTSTVGWSTDELATKLVVVSTDAGPHFEGDSASGSLPVFSESNVRDENIDQCLARYYPSPNQIQSRVKESGAYVASLVYDGDWADNWPSRSWKAFNSFIGQSDDFVAPQAPDSSDFWQKLATVIEKIEEIECAPPTTLPPTLPPATTTHPAATDGECVCPCVDCGCCPQVIIRLQHRPSSLHLDVEN